MNIEKAKELLSYHSGYNENFESLKWTNGFLGQLRPYKGRLYENNFFELVEILKALQPEFQNSDKIDRDIVAMLFAIVTVPRLWAFDPQGMLRSNNLISKSDLNQLNDCLIRLSEGIEYLLNSADDIDCIMTGYGEEIPDYFEWKER